MRNDAMTKELAQARQRIAELQAAQSQHGEVDRALQALLDFNESVLQSMGEALVVLDSQGHITFTNPAVEALLGYGPEELVGQHWTVVVPADQRSTVQAADERRARGESDRYELELLCKDGTRIPVLISGTPRFEDGRFAGTLAVFTDITELKEAEQEIRRRSDELAAVNSIALTLSGALHVKEVLGTIQDRVPALLEETYPPMFALFDESTQTFRTMLTGAVDELVNKIDRLLGVEMRNLSVSMSEMQPHVQDALLNGRPYASRDGSDFLGSRVSGKLLHGAQLALAVKSITAVPLWAKAKLVGCMLICSKNETVPHDRLELLSFIASQAAIAIENARLYEALRNELVERERAEEALTEYSERLEEMVEERSRELEDAQEELVRKEKLATLGQLAGGVSHELRNPLGVISNAVYYLKMTLSDADETTREYLDMISSEVPKSEKIVSDLLGLSGVRTPQKEETEVSTLITQSLERVPPPEGTTLNVNLPPDLPLVFVDSQQIEQVLTNLITNAYQAMPDGGALTIQGGTDGHRVAVSICDTGVGITVENVQKIFEPLFTTKSRGIGLGLALSQSLVEANEGSIEVQSEEGKGSTFTVLVPTNEATTSMVASLVTPPEPDTQTTDQGALACPDPCGGRSSTDSGDLNGG